MTLSPISCGISLNARVGYGRSSASALPARSSVCLVAFVSSRVCSPGPSWARSSSPVLSLLGFGLASRSCWTHTVFPGIVHLRCRALPSSASSMHLLPRLPALLSYFRPHEAAPFDAVPVAEDADVIAERERVEQTFGTNGISLLRLCKKFDDFVAVKSLSVNIQKGDIFGLLGPNVSVTRVSLVVVSLTRRYCRALARARP